MGKGTVWWCKTTFDINDIFREKKIFYGQVNRNIDLRTLTFSFFLVVCLTPDNAHMGQFPQDGENGQNVAFFLIFFGALLWPNGLILSAFLNCFVYTLPVLRKLTHMCTKFQLLVMDEFFIWTRNFFAYSQEQIEISNQDSSMWNFIVDSTFPYSNPSRTKHFIALDALQTFNILSWVICWFWRAAD